ncbi:hypothetical protein HO133_009744 [Letharia lupina]|uniref:Uncharacterized protein n=1 Tax=Letharia lupina TaxID=560253 RepID=A0A8H6FEN8_9LECA|nr:uncharacterized protein HO133_009744 [Letharia lupina]KAF6225742.1 hypothetical protein HO133_009744 [Letharia lupina]
MNENLNERFGRGKAIRDSRVPRALTARPSTTLNLSIREYAKTAGQPADPSHWTGFREIPSPSEVFDEGRTEHGTTLELTENSVVGPYISKEDYLETHYRLLREDAVAPLRDVVSEIQVYPHIMEKESDNSAYIYEKVFIIGLTFANAGIAARVTFSLRRIGKKVNWEQSKRLLTGAVLALTPAKDMFASVCRVAIVAARPLAGLEQNPPELDIFFGGPDEFEIDPQQEWVMVESRNGFYEGSRFPLSEHIVDIQRVIRPPRYLEQQPRKNLSSLFPTAVDEVLNVDTLEEWPAKLPSGLDPSQMDALKRILSKRLAIVQGPPGTGKTHVSVIALRLLLENLGAEDPPIIIAAHTNHALDQLLRHIAKFEPGFIRLGAWTKDTEVIKPQTLFEIKDAIKHSNPTGGLRNPALRRLKQLAKEMTILLAPLTEGRELLNSRSFEQYNVISYDQYYSLVKGAKEWIRAGAEDDPLGDIATWLGDERIEANYRTMPEDFGIEVEEVVEYEQLKEIEAESKLVDDEDRDSLRGLRLVFNEPFTGRQSTGVTDETVQFEMQKRDLWNIPRQHRGPVYRHMQQGLKAAITKKFRELARQYAAASQDAKSGLWELDYNYLKQAKVIGMTTTGLSKYRGLIQSLDPKVVLIEEAAETLEAFVSVACFESLEHLILIGDHRQLRGHCNDQELAGNPYYLGISMFERLARNKVEFSQLKRQRRMIPEIRRALKPIYEKLEDHPSVLDRLPIPGMGGVNSYFFTHEGRETTDSQMSKINQAEAEMLVTFFYYLVLNGMAPGEITVLTFYNGQRKLIMRKLREHRHLQGAKFTVVTVDSYQGEENEVVLLSLVRSNIRGNIGFLEVENRVCVALSRARRGFYIFGDAPNLCRSSMLWWHIIQAMAKDPCRVGFYLHLTCKKHNEKTFIKVSRRDVQEPAERRCHAGIRVRWDVISFLMTSSDCACDKKFESVDRAVALTGSSKETHAAPLDYAEGATGSSNIKTSPYYPQAGAANYATVFNGTPEKKKKLRNSSQFSGPPQLEDRQPYRNIPHDTQSYRDFAAGGHVESDKNLAAMVEREAAEARGKQLDEENFAALFSDPGDAVLLDKTKKMTLVRTMSNGKGGSRGVWKGVWNKPPRSKDASPSKKEEVSLLDS